MGANKNSRVKEDTQKPNKKWLNYKVSFSVVRFVTDYIIFEKGKKSHKEDTVGAGVCKTYGASLR